MVTTKTVAQVKIATDKLDALRDRFGQHGDTNRDLMNRVADLLLATTNTEQTPQPVTSELSVSDVNNWEPDDANELPFTQSPTVYQDQIDEIRALLTGLAGQVTTANDDAKYAIELAGSAKQHCNRLVKQSNATTKVLNKWRSLPTISDELDEIRATSTTSNRTRKTARRQPSALEMNQQAEDLDLYSFVLGDDA